jgi:hypothetical protein
MTKDFMQRKFQGLTGTLCAGKTFVGPSITLDVRTYASEDSRAESFSIMFMPDEAEKLAQHLLRLVEAQKQEP